jgi:hypothetical protein
MRWHNSRTEAGTNEVGNQHALTEAERASWSAVVSEADADEGADEADDAANEAANEGASSANEVAISKPSLRDSSSPECAAPSANAAIMLSTCNQT